MKKNEERPFYLPNDKQMSSCHIVNEARTATARPLLTARPFTPLPSQRRLFGTCQRSSARPPSAITLDELSYENPSLLQSNRLPSIKASLPSDTDAFQHKIQPLLQQINQQSPDEVTETQIKTLADCIDENLKFNEWKKGPQRSQALKTLFKLLNSKNPAVLLQVSRLLISLEIGGKNRAPLAKVIFTLARDEINDQHFLQTKQFAECLLRLIELMDIREEWEALTYAVGAVKLLSINQKLLQLLSKAGAVSTLTNILQTLLNPKEEKWRESEEIEHILFQLTGSLRNMADLASNRHHFVNCSTVTLLISLLADFPQATDVILNVARILSKLTMYYEICNSVTESSEESLQVVSSVLLCLRQQQNVIVRLCFALSNVAAKNDRARLLLFHKSNIIPTLLQLLDQHHCDRTRFQTEFLDYSKTETNSDEEREVEIKIISLIANMSINSQVGAELAADAELYQRLLTRINFQQDKDPDELSLTVLSTLSNLSYYFSAQNQLFSSSNLKNLSKFIAAQLNSSVNQQVLSECLRLASNISRAEEPRKLLAASKVGVMTLRLMNEKSLNQDVQFLCCGLMVNLIAEESSRLDVKKENGVDSFTEILSKASDDGDWQLAGVVCQLLWNYLALSPPNVQLEWNLLSNLLQRHLNNSVNSDHDLWKLEFCPVAARLHLRIFQDDKKQTEN